MRISSRIFSAGLGLAMALGLAACGEGEKPTRQEAIDGWEMIIGEQFSKLGYDEGEFEMIGLTEESLDAYYECFVDEIYDDVSATTLQNLASGDSSSSIAEDDQPIIEEANELCLESVGF